MTPPVNKRTKRTDVLVEEARRLYQPGVYGWKQIGKQLGVSATTVRRWLDPEYEERSRAANLAAKKRRTGTCIDCGGITRYSGHGEQDGCSTRCVPCRKEFARASDQQQYWTRERLIDAIQRWVAEHGEPPAVPDWCPTSARYLGDETRAQRFENYPPRTYPWFVTVVRRFGSWNAGIAAAGYTPRVAHGGDGNQLRRRIYKEQPEQLTTTLNRVYKQHFTTR